MKCDFVTWIECTRMDRVQMDPTPRPDAYVSENAAPLRMVTNVVLTTTSPMSMSEQKSII